MGEQITVAIDVLEVGERVLATSAAYFAGLCEQNGRISTTRMDQYQRSLFDLAASATNLAAARQLLNHAHRYQADEQTRGQLVVHLALLNAATAVQELRGQIDLRAAELGLDGSTPVVDLNGTAVTTFLRQQRANQNIETAAKLLLQTNNSGPNGLNAEQRDLQAIFRRFAQEKVAPFAEEIHREDRDLPETMLRELAQMGCFGLSIPERYGGFQNDTQPDHMAMVIVSAELARASFGTAGSLITRPELLAKALLQGGTEAQKQKWLPLIATGERQAAVAITEPDFGSDVARLATAARKVPGGWRLNGSKMWCTFAGRADLIVVLARTDPDLSQGHRGLTLFIVEKPAATGHNFSHTTNGGSVSGYAIPTIGYRGMHSFALTFDDYFVPDVNVIGEKNGLGRGFYLQMHSFSGSRLQTAARALGVMTAAFYEALKYTRERQVFGRPLCDYQLVQHKLVAMARLIQAGRQFTYHAARELDAGRGAETAAMAKFFTGRAAEWVTREALQLHGGMGYAEEFPVSRHFVDARVFSIFEGAEEVLALRIIARGLLRECL